MRFRGRPRASPLVAAGFVLFLLRTIYTITTADPPTRHSSSNRLQKPSLQVLLTSTDQEKLDLCSAGWLQSADEYFTFSRDGGGLPNSLLTNKRKEADWFRTRAQLVFAGLYLPMHSEWIILAHDDAIVLLDELRRDLAAFDSDEPHYAVVGTHNFERPRSVRNHRVVILSRGAVRTLLRRIERGADGCSVDGSLDECLHGVSRLSMEQDSHSRYRYQVVNRHFDRNEMRTFSRQYSSYNDGFQVINQLSPSLFCLLGLSADDLRIFSVLLSRVRLFI